MGQGWWAERVAGQTEAQFSPLVLLGKDRSRLEKGAEEGTGASATSLPAAHFSASCLPNTLEHQGQGTPRAVPGVPSKCPIALAQSAVADALGQVT